MLAATGVRGLRLVNETESFARLTMTEAGPAAQACLRENAQRFESRGASCRSFDARQPLATGEFDYVDLDPYGSPLPFLDAAFAALRPGGVLAVTATDMPVLAGVQKGVAERRYGGRAVRGRFGPESGLRILLGHLAGRAQQRGLNLRPLLSYVLDHHIRAYVALVPSAAAGPGEAVGTIDPAQWDGAPLPPGGPYGPMWLAGLFDRDLVARLAVPSTAERPRELAQLIGRFQEESAVDRPFYFEANSLAQTLHLASPPPLAGLLSALRTKGYAAVRSHMRGAAFRTDAPRAVVERVALSFSTA